MALIMDVQGFLQPGPRGGTVFVTKELALVDPKMTGKAEAIIFDPSCPWKDLPEPYQRFNSWLTRYEHGIPWNSGETPYSELVSVLREKLENVKVVFVRGHKKKCWLKALMGNVNVINLNKVLNSSLRNIKVTACWYKMFHKLVDNNKSNHHYCALENARRMRIWMNEKSLFKEYL